MVDKKNKDLKSRDAEIVGILRAGTHTLQEVGELYGVSKQRVRQIGDRANVKNRRNEVRRAEAAEAKKASDAQRAEEQKDKEEQREAILYLREEGLTYKEIAKEEFGDEGLWRRAQEICLAAPPEPEEVDVIEPPSNPKRDKNIYQLFLKGHDKGMIAEALDLDADDVQAIIDREKKDEVTA